MKLTLRYHAFLIVGVLLLGLNRTFAPIFPPPPSPPLYTIEKVGTAMIIHVTGSPYASYTLYASDNLGSGASWGAIVAGTTGGTGHVDIQDLNWTAHPQRFYYVKVTPP